MRLLLGYFFFHLLVCVHAQEAYTFTSDSTVIRDVIEQAKAAQLRGEGLNYEGKTQEASLAFQEAANIIIQNDVHAPKLLAKCTQQAALSFARLEWYDLAEELAFQSIALARNLEDPVTLAIDYGTLGEIYQRQGKWDKALSYLDSCLQIDRSLGDTAYIAGDLSLIGRINTQIGREKEGMDQLRKSLELTSSKKYDRAHCVGLNALGLGFQQTDDFTNAEKYLLESLELSVAIRDTDLIINRYINLGDLYVKTGEIASAEQYLLKSLSLLNDHYQPFKYTVIYRNLGEVFRQKGAYDKAISYYEQALEIAEEKELLPDIRLVYKHLHTIHQEQGNYRLALEYSDKFNELSDTIFTMNTRIRADIFNNRFAMAEKEKAIQALHFNNEMKLKDLANLKTQRGWLLVTILLGILIAGLGFYAFRERQKNALMRKETTINEQIDEIKQLREEVAAKLAEKQQNVKATSRTLDEINQLIPSPLTEREYEIVQLVVLGKSNQEIANEVFLSINTIKFHLKKIYAKLDVRNRLGIAQLALNQELPVRVVS